MAAAAVSGIHTATPEEVIGADSSTLRYRYELSDRGHKVELGRGTYGEVYAATDLNTHAHIAIKEIIIKRHGGDIAFLKREIELHSTLQHENIVQYRAAVQETGVLKIFMERVNGGSLSDLLRYRWGALLRNEPAMQHYTRQMLNGLNYLHNNNIIHRDIKGTNMLIDTYQGILKLADFGTSKAVATIATQADNTNYVGTPLYMAPEVINHQLGEGYSVKADIWSLGCTVIEMATATTPFRTMEQANGITCIIFQVGSRRLQPNIPHELSTPVKQFIESCLSLNADDRPLASVLLNHPFITGTSRPNALPISTPPPSNKTSNQSSAHNQVSVVRVLESVASPESIGVRSPSAKYVIQQPQAQGQGHTGQGQTAIGQQVDTMTGHRESGEVSEQQDGVDLNALRNLHPPLGTRISQEVVGSLKNLNLGTSGGMIRVLEEGQRSHHLASDSGTLTRADGSTSSDTPFKHVAVISPPAAGRLGDTNNNSDTASSTKTVTSLNSDMSLPRLEHSLISNPTSATTAESSVPVSEDSVFISRLHLVDPSINSTDPLLNSTKSRHSVGAHGESTSSSGGASTLVVPSTASGTASAEDRRALRLARSLSTASSSTDSLSMGPPQEFVDAVQFCPYGKVPQVAKRLKRTPEPSVVETVIESINRNNRVPESGTADLFLQSIIPSAAKTRDLTLLLRISTVSSDYAVRKNALEYLTRCLYRSAEHLESVEKLLPELEPRLRVSLTNEMWTEPPTCALYRQHAYLLLLAHVYIQWLLKVIDNNRITNLLKTREDVMKNLKRYKTERVDRLKFECERFNYVYAFVKHILIMRLASNRLSFITKGPALKEVKRTSEVLKDLVFLSTHSVPGMHKDVLRKCQKLDMYDLHVFLHFMVSKVCETSVDSQESLIMFIKQMLYSIECEGNHNMITINMDSVISTLYAFTRLFSQIHNPAICQQLITCSSKRELGFNSLLKLLHSKLPFRALIPVVCSALLFHPVETIAQEVLKYGYGTTFDRSPKDAALDHITRAHKEYIHKILSVHSVKDYTKSLACHQCSSAHADKWHEVWEARCDFERHVVVSFERPYEARMKGLRLNSGEAKTLVKDIEILRMLSQTATHPNIIQMLAYQSAVLPRFYVAESLGTTMTLSQFLIHRRNVRPQLTLIDLLQSGVLPAISAVQHCQDSGIILRNITASAFLARDLGATFTIKLHAFHLARKGTGLVNSPGKATALSRLCYHGTKLEELPLLWSAPESLLQCMFTEYSDTFMVGHTILEILTHGQTPYTELSALTVEEKITQVHRHGIRPEKPPAVPVNIFQAAMTCHATVPHRRTSLHRLQGTLKAIAQTLSNLMDAVPEEEVIGGGGGDQTFCGGGAKGGGAQQDEEQLLYLPVPESLRNIQDIKDFQELKPEHVLFDIDDLEESAIKCAQKELYALDDPYINKEQTELLSRVLPGRHLSGAHLHLLRQLSHPHLLPMLGHTYDNYQHLFLRYSLPHPHPLCSLLQHVLSSSSADVVSLSWCIAVFAQIADAVSYLHQEALLHGFLAARFVYVMPDGNTVKLCQFSRTCILEEGPYDSGLDTVTVQPFQGLDAANKQILDKATRWSAREVNVYGTYSMRSDTANFASLMWEVLRARLCSANTPHTHVAPYSNVALKDVLKYQERRQTLPQPDECPVWLYTLIKKCTLDPWYRRPLFPEILDCLRAEDPNNHPLAQTPMIGDEMLPDVFDHDDALYGFYENGTHRYRKQHNYQKWQDEFLKVLKELKSSSSKHIQDQGDSKTDPRYQSVPRYCNYPMNSASGVDGQVPFLKSTSRSSSHFYFDVSDDDAYSSATGTVGAVSQKGSVGARTRTSNSLTELKEKPPVPPRAKETKIKRFFSKLMKKDKVKTPPGSPWYVRKAKSTSHIQQYACDSEDDPSYLTVDDLPEATTYRTPNRRSFHRAGSRLCMDLDRVKMSDELYEDSNDHYDLSGIDYNEFGSDDDKPILDPISPPHYENYESNYDEIPFHGRESTIQEMPLPPIPGKQQEGGAVDIYMNTADYQLEEAIAPLSSSAEEADLEDSYARCMEDEQFVPHSSAVLNIDDTYMDPAESADELEVGHDTPPPLPLSPPPGLSEDSEEEAAVMYTSVDKSTLTRRSSEPNICRKSSSQRSSSSSEEEKPPRVPSKSFTDLSEAFNGTPGGEEENKPESSSEDKGKKEKDKNVFKRLKYSMHDKEEFV